MSSLVTESGKSTFSLYEQQALHYFLNFFLCFPWNWVCYSTFVNYCWMSLIQSIVKVSNQLEKEGQKGKQSKLSGLTHTFNDCIEQHWRNSSSGCFTRGKWQKSEEIHFNHNRSFLKLLGSSCIKKRIMQKKFVKLLNINFWHLVLQRLFTRIIHESRIQESSRKVEIWNQAFNSIQTTRSWKSWEIQWTH